MKRFLLYLCLVGPLVVALSPQALAVDVIRGLNFTGTSRLDQLALGVFEGGGVPDTMGAVGPDHIALLINGSFTVYDKTGAMQLRVDRSTFWETAMANAGTPGGVPSGAIDPRLLYDPHSSRWYAVTFGRSESAASRYNIAVTTGDDPALENWRAFTIDADPTDQRWLDFPRLGINADGLFMAGTMKPITLGSAIGSNLAVLGIPKQSLTAATPSVAGYKLVTEISHDITGTSLQPVVDMDNGHLSLPALSAPDITAGKLRKSVFSADFFDPSGGLSTPQIPPIPFNNIKVPKAPDVNDNDTIPQGQQPGADPIDIADSRFSGNVIKQGGLLWGVHVVDHENRAAVAWYKIDPKGDDVQGELIQSGLIADPDMDYYYPSIAVNPYGHMVIGFNGSGSSQNQFVSSYAVVGHTLTPVLLIGGSPPPFGQPSEPLVEFSDPILLQAGVDDYERIIGSRNRWGDYSATVVDPKNPLKFWTFQEIVSGKDEWATQITELTFVPNPERVNPGDDQCVVDTNDSILSADCAYVASFEQNFGGPNDIRLDDFQLADFRNIVFFGSDPINVGNRQTASADALLNGLLTVDGSLISLTGLPAQIEFNAIVENIDGNSRILDNQLTNLFLDLRGLPDLPFDAWIDLDPSMSADGTMVIHEFEPRLYHIPSFFDVRTRLHLDFDRDGQADQILIAGSTSRLLAHSSAVAIPEPSTLILVALGLLSLGCYGWRRRKWN